MVGASPARQIAAEFAAATGTAPHNLFYHTFTSHRKSAGERPNSSALRALASTSIASAMYPPTKKYPDSSKVFFIFFKFSL